MERSSEVAGSEVTGGENLTRARVAEGALRQAARHEWALRTCLAELDGRGSPSDPRVAALLARAARHALRARGLARTAARLNRDPREAAAIAAVVERCERAELLVARWGTPAVERLAPTARASRR
jgi:hypothetical protein